MNHILKCLKIIIAAFIGIVLMLASRDIYRFFYGIGEYGVHDTFQEYTNGKISGSFGKVNEEVVLDELFDNRRILRLVFAPFGTRLQIDATYPLDTYEGDSTIRIEGPDSVHYTETSDGNALIFRNTLDNPNQQSVHKYFDYNRDGRLDCICKEEDGKVLKVWILSGKCMVAVTALPLKSDDGNMQVSDGLNIYCLTGEIWQHSSEGDARDSSS